jgi:riboflavin kinase/FMN adenylyltransferase
MTAVRIDELPRIGPAVITLGVFDGVHLGHRRVVAATSEAARARSASCVALVFTPHPDEVIRPGVRVPRILPPSVTLERLHAAGIDQAVEVRFDASLRALDPEAFLDALAPAIELRAITMTPESAFGRGRAGTFARVTEISRTHGFDAVAVPAATNGAAPVSSSRIRELVAAGEVEAAAMLLNGTPVLRGTVVSGDRRGRELGFPTANLAFDYHPQLPKLGIYIGAVEVPERGVGPGHPALVSVGVRPTFHDEGQVLVEVYLLDWDGDLYGAELTVELLGRLRDELRFDSIEALVQQMRADEAEARRRLAVDGT